MIAIRLSLITFLMIAFATADAAGGRIYKTVDEQGNVVFTDVPPPEEDTSSQVVVENPNSFDPKEAIPEAESWVVETPEAAAEPVFSYEALSIASPQNDESVRENAGNITIIANVEPKLRPGHVMRLLIDGAPAQEGHQTTFTLANVDRGTHVVTLEIADAGGRVIKRSEDSTFHMLRYAIKPAPKPTPRPSGG
ncbi:MAG: DUF4124 domain-containing protein [Pseudomonadales bacterium]